MTSNKKFIWGVFIAHIALITVFFSLYYRFYINPKTEQFITTIVSNSDSNNVGEYVTSASEPKTTQTTTNGKVTGVVDGDTLKVNINNESKKVRLLAIDTPETKDPRKPVQCYGAEATKKMTELVLNKEVRLEIDPSQGDTDKYGRLLRYVYLADGTNINAVTVKEGYAFAYRKYPTSQLNQMIQYETEAREKQLGLWSPNTCNGKP